jgi:hypothetical protein
MEFLDDNVARETHSFAAAFGPRSQRARRIERIA